MTNAIRLVLVSSLLLLSLSSFTGCVQRRLIIRSQPEGAIVTIDNRLIGRTPLSTEYTYSGGRELKLELDGYKTVKVQERIDPTWYETFPISLVTENFAGREIRDERVLDFQMEPKVQVPENQLLDRANDLRFNVNRGGLTTPLR